MRSLPTLALVAGMVGLLALPARALPPIPATPAPILKLVAARPFIADEALGYRWDHSQAPSRRGWLLVIEADPGLVAIRQLAEPNLVVGEHLAVRAGRPSPEGRALYLVPADVDLARAPIFFGAAKLPEEVSADDVQQAVDLAREAHLIAPSPSEVAAALAAGGAEIHIQSFADLRAASDDLRARFIPEPPTQESTPAGGARP